MMKVLKGTVKTDNFEMDYFSFGSGSKTAVIIPGMSVKPVSGAAEAVAARYEILLDDYTVYVFERKKGELKITDTVFTMADETSVAMEKLGLKDAYVVGVSQGGMIAQFIAVRFPHLVRKLIITSSLSKQNAISYETFCEWENLALSGDAKALNKSINSKVYSKEYYEKYKVAFEAPQSEGTPEELKRFAVLSYASGKFDLFGEIDKIKCPIFVIGSNEDKVLAPVGSREISEKTGCEIYMYDGYSHGVYDEAPDFIERVKEFFER